MKVGVQVIDKIGSSTLMGCGFDLVKGELPGTKQGPQTPIPPVPSGSSNRTSFEALQQEQHRLQSELTEVKGALAEEKELHAKCHKDLLALLAALTANYPHLLPEITLCLLISSLFLHTIYLNLLLSEHCFH